MKKLAVVLLLTFVAQSVYAFGLFPRHHHDSGGSPVRRSSDTVLPPIPEPETYLFILVGVGVVAWIIRKNKK
jgi:PEP-CTERM motif-containing protein